MALRLAQAPISGPSHGHQDQTTLLVNLEFSGYLSCAAEEQKKVSPDIVVCDGQLKENRASALTFEMGVSAKTPEHLSSPAYSRFVLEPKNLRSSPAVYCNVLKVIYSNYFICAKWISADSSRVLPLWRDILQSLWYLFLGSL